MYRLLICAAIVALSVSFLQAQVQPCTLRSGSMMDMQVLLSFDDQSPFRRDSTNTGVGVDNDQSHGGGASGEQHQDLASGMQIRVQLQDALGSNLQDSSPNSEGKVVFRVCSRLTYRLRVNGANIDEAVVESLNPGKGDRVVNVTLHHKGPQQTENTNKAMISAARLQVPRKAQKELEKGDSALAQGKLQEARERFEKALQVYPKFDQAYNNLGVALMQLGDNEGGRKAFEQAIQANDHFARAYVNLGKIAFDDKKYGVALDLAHKALGTEPFNPSGLFLAAEAAFFAGSFDDTVAYTKTLHTLPHGNFALAHFLSAKSLQAKNLFSAAIAEYELFLKEDPRDANTTSARQAIAQLQPAAAARTR